MSKNVQNRYDRYLINRRSWFQILRAVIVIIRMQPPGKWEMRKHVYLVPSSKQVKSLQNFDVREAQACGIRYEMTVVFFDHQ